MHRIAIALHLCLSAALLATPAPAQTPARFPAFPEAQIESLLRNATCSNRITTIARTLGETPGWRGFAMLLCSPDNQRDGVFVAWQRRTGRRDFVPARADGQPFVMPDRASVTDGDQQAQVTIFVRGTRAAPQVCWFGRNTRMNEPFAASFCADLDAQGHIIPRR